MGCFNPIALRKAKIVYNFGLSECDRVNIGDLYKLKIIFFFVASETMSVPTFHYIQVQLYEYYEMQTMEKKEAIVWGNRSGPSCLTCSVPNGPFMVHFMYE